MALLQLTLMLHFLQSGACTVRRGMQMRSAVLGLQTPAPQAPLQCSPHDKPGRLGQHNPQTPHFNVLAPKFIPVPQPRLHPLEQPAPPPLPPPRQSLTQ
jgi:hypothetical protein